MQAVPHLGKVGAAGELDVDLVNGAGFAKQALRLGDVHDRQFGAGQRVEGMKVDQCANGQAHHS